MEAILAAHDLTNWQGRRDHAILLTLYNSGARVSEVISMRGSLEMAGNRRGVQLLLQTDKLLPWCSPGIA